MKIVDVEEKREERLKRNEESLRELRDNVKHTNMRVMWCQKEKREREKGTEKVSEELIGENFPNMGKEPLTQIQEVQQVPYKIHPRRNTLRRMLIKLTKIKDRENTESS